MNLALSLGGKFVPNNKTERPILIIDGMNLFVRFFCARQDMTSTGEPVGGLVGFLKAINRLSSDFVPSRLYVVWEQGGASPRRRHIYEGYKASRSKDKNLMKAGSNNSSNSSSGNDPRNDTENKIKQLHLLTQLIKHLPVCQIFVPDTECDDIVAHLLRSKFAGDNCRKILVSSDKDFYQLLEDPSIEIYDPAKRILVSGQKVLDEYGISPRNFCLARTMAGDPSDNIPGVEGIGLKTVAKRFPDLARTDMDLQPGDLIALCEKHINENKSKIKAYKDVLSSETILIRNWKLMYLGSSSLSASQIQKVDYAVETHVPKMDKFGLIKGLLGAKIITDINFDNVSIQLKTTLVE